MSDPSQNVFYFSPRDDETKNKMDRLFYELSGEEIAQIQKIKVKGSSFTHE